MKALKMMAVMLVLGTAGSVCAQTTTDEEIVLQKDLKIGFGTLHDSLFKLVNKTLADRFDGVEHCEKTGKPNDPRPPEKRYRCGEIPFGDIYNSNWKNVAEFAIDGQSSNSGGVSLETYATRIAVWMGRPQYQGTMEINDLDTLQKRSIVTDKRFGRDLYVRYSPETVQVDGKEARALRMQFCTAIPGTYWTIPQFQVHGKGRKKIAFIKISSGFTVTVNPGQLMYRYVKVCGQLQTLLNPHTQVPELKVLSLENPQLIDAKHEGLTASVKVHNWLVNLVLKLFVGQDKANKMVRDAIQKKLDSVLTEKDMQTGKWLEKLQDEFLDRRDVKKSLANALEKAVNSELAHMNYTNPARYKAELNKLCDDFDSKIPQVQNKFREECRRFVANSSIEITPFLRKADERDLGCYSHMASLSSTRQKVGEVNQKKWWYHKCTQSVNVRLKIRGSTAPFISCLADAQGVITSGMSTEQRIKVLARCGDLALDLLKAKDKVQPILASVEEALKRLKTKIPDEGIDFVPGQWPMVDLAILRASPLAKGLEFLRNGDSRVFELDRDLKIGPNIPFAPGDYSVQIWAAVSEEAQKAPERLGVIEVWDTARQERLASQALWSDLTTQTPVPLKFTVPSSESKVEFRFRWDRAVDLRLHRIRLKKAN